MNLHDFYFDLPKELIAQTPLTDRTASRLLTLDKHTGEIRHRVFSDIIEYIQAGDCLVLNETKVIPARIYGQKKETGAKIEFLLLKKAGDNLYDVLIKPGKRIKQGDTVVFGEGLLEAKALDTGQDDGVRTVQFTYSRGIFEQILAQLGEMPLPPYITEKLSDQSRYQTVYANKSGSAAAPTAGLHFTQELLERLEKKDVSIARLTLHVGLGTFRPVKTENIMNHKMHSEYFEIDQANANKINTAKQQGGKIIAVGTTSIRTLESVSDAQGHITPCSGHTDIFIYPGYQFKITDQLITNFHLPESTLIMLVSALCGRESILNAYNEAIKERYRFFSFGDAMFIY